MLVSVYVSSPSADVLAKRVGMTTDMAVGTRALSIDDTYRQRECATSDLARSGSWDSVSVTNATRRGKRYRAILWSAAVGTGCSKSDLMQFAAIFAV